MKFPHHSELLNIFSICEACYLDVFWHICYIFGMDHTWVVVFQKGQPERPHLPLANTNRCAQEVQISFEVLSNFSHQMLEVQWTSDNM
jgi:hypothetical protein